VEFTVEQRRLLDGDETRKERREKLLGFADASGAPDWAKVRILQIRSAVVQGRTVPAPSRAFVAGCEQRSLERRALGHAARIGATHKRSLQDIFLAENGYEYHQRNSNAAVAKRNGITVEALEDAQLRLKLKDVGEQIRRESLCY
jgi:hypothetical protein